MDILPREDISGQITDSVIKKLGEKDWKMRKEGLDDIQAIINGANKRIQSNLGGLMPALKARLSDSNKNLVVNVLELLGLIATSMGPSIEKHMKSIIPAMFTCFADTKKNIRDSTAAW